MRPAVFHTTAIAAFIISGWAVYLHTLPYPLLFDDIPNIGKNRAIRIKRLDRESIHRIFTESPVKSRPVANLSYAINNLFADDDSVPCRHIRVHPVYDEIP